MPIGHLRQPRAPCPNDDFALDGTRTEPHCCARQDCRGSSCCSAGFLDRGYRQLFEQGEVPTRSPSDKQNDSVVDRHGDQGE
jgi:hypothetical protein